MKCVSGAQPTRTTKEMEEKHMGFSGLMTGLLNANAALGQAQIHQRTASHLDSRANILKTEIKSGLGDVEGKQAELEEVEQRMVKVQDMQMQSLNDASNKLGTSLMPEEDEKDTGKKDNDKTVSDKAKDESTKLQDKNENTNVAAVDYKSGIHIGEADKTNVAVSPKLLEKMADSEPLSQLYQKHIASMAEIDNSVRQTEGGSKALHQIWAVNSSGQVSHHAYVANAKDAEVYEATRQQIDAAGREAFGDAFAGAYVQVKPVAAVSNPDNIGLLISADV